MTANDYKKTMFYLVLALTVLFIYTFFTYLISYIYNINLFYVTFLNFLSYTLFVPFIASLIKNGRVNVLEPIYIVNGTFYLYFVFQPSMDLLFNNRYFFGVDYFSQLPMATTYVAIGIIMLMIGYYSNFGVSISRRIIKKFFIKNTNNNPNSKIKSFNYAIFLSIISFVGFYYYLKTIGGSFIGTITLNIISGSHHLYPTLNDQFSNPFVNYFGSMYLFSVGGFMILYAFQKRWRLLLIPLFLIIFALSSTMGARFVLIILILSPIIYEYIKRNKVPKLTHIVTIILILFLIFGIIGALRVSIQSNKISHYNSSINLHDIWLEFSYDAGIYNTFYAMIKNIPKNYNFVYGYTYLAALIQPIPRALLPNKGSGGPSIGLNIFDGNPIPAESGVAYPMIGDFYVNFGIIGIVIFMFVFGISLRLLWEYLRLLGKSNWTKIIFAISLSYLIQFISRGSPSQILTQWFFIVFPVIFGQWLTNRFSLRSK